MNDEPQPTNSGAKHLVRHGHTGLVNGVQAAVAGITNLAKSKGEKAAADKAVTAPLKAVSLAAPAEATKAVISVETTSPQAACQANMPHPQSPMARRRPAVSPLACRVRRVRLLC
eukprot:scaffold87815_cov59-Phaeocystis_antarctica.AAC.2